MLSMTATMRDPMVAIPVVVIADRPGVEIVEDAPGVGGLVAIGEGRFRQFAARQHGEDVPGEGDVVLAAEVGDVVDAAAEGRIEEEDVAAAAALQVIAAAAAPDEVVARSCR